MPVGRVIFLMMDSLGVGASHDAAFYGDTGANTFRHIVEACRDGRADQVGVRSGVLNIPHLSDVGLYHVACASAKMPFVDLSCLKPPRGLYGYAVEKSLGKDTPSGHWELMGTPVMEPWGYFPNTPSCFPNELIRALKEQANLAGVLGEKHASGIDIINEWGDQHIKTGYPIVYTSGDSVFQIAAHEKHFGLERLYEVCRIARTLVDPYLIGRVIARPFVGEEGVFRRTGNRQDFSIPPPDKTLLDYLCEHQREVIAIGKIADIFAHRGVTQTVKADGNMALFDATLEALKSAPAGSLIFTNFVDFDSSYGHRRDLAGYARALEAFDERLPQLDALLAPDDVVVIAADHGCDPTFPGSDHTREHIPVIVYGPRITSRCIGQRDTFADVGQSLALHLQIPPLPVGASFLS